MRTQVDTVTQNPTTLLFAVSFITYAGTAGAEYTANRVSSAHIFSTEDAAYAAGQRALTMLAEHNRYPNMCEYF